MQRKIFLIKHRELGKVKANIEEICNIHCGAYLFKGVLSRQMRELTL